MLHFPSVLTRRIWENIEFTPHAVESLKKRGVTQEEVIEAIKEAEHLPTKLGRIECEKEFCYNAEWHGKYYRMKKVRPVFKEKGGGILVITAYSFYY